MTGLPPFLALACALCATPPLQAQASEALQLLLTPAPVPMISYALVGRLNAVNPADVFEIEISESGGITDVFIRLSPAATSSFAEWTTLATGFPMRVSICGAHVLETDIDAPVTTGTLYIPNLDAVQAEALRAVWQGRATCFTLPPEVFPIGQ